MEKELNISKMQIQKMMQNKKEFMSFYYIKLTRKDTLRTQSVQENFDDDDDDEV